MSGAPPIRVRAYNTARRDDLTIRSHREEMVHEFDLAESRGDLDLALWARAWGEAIRQTAVSGHARIWSNQMEGVRFKVLDR